MFISCFMLLAYSLSYVCEKEKVVKEVDETMYELPKIGQGWLLTIDGYPVCEGYGTVGKLIYSCIFYCLYCFKEISVHIV